MIGSDERLGSSLRMRFIPRSRVVVRLALLSLLPGCAAANSSSPFSPASPNAAAVTTLFWVILVIAAVIFVGVEAFLFYTLVRYRQRPGATSATFAGNTRLEVIWTAIPAAILFVVFYLSVRTLVNIRPPLGDPVEINVTGHQWWWEVEYPTEGFSTANGLHAPVGETVIVHLTSNDVIHSFWLPSLSPKLDAIPGQSHVLWFLPRAVGVYQGYCSEFCGLEHAWMLFSVQADSPADYQTWVAGQRQPPPAPTGLAIRGQQLYQSQGCGNCHAITGLGSTARVGPNLTHVASRPVIGGGVLSNTPDNMRRWLENPQAIKPGSLMPNYRFSSDELQAVTAYVESLR